jgi:hypothetical protein
VFARFENMATDQPPPRIQNHAKVLLTWPFHPLGEISFEDDISFTRDIPIAISILVTPKEINIFQLAQLVKSLVVE